jgi:hypothetical protein
MRSEFYQLAIKAHSVRQNAEFGIIDTASHLARKSRRLTSGSKLAGLRLVEGAKRLVHSPRCAHGAA